MGQSRHYCEEVIHPFPTLRHSIELDKQGEAAHLRTSERSRELNRQYTRLGAVALDMELSAVLMAAIDLGKRAGGILTVGSNLVTTENQFKGQRVDEFKLGERNMIKIALETIKRLDSQ